MNSPRPARPVRRHRSHQVARVHDPRTVPSVTVAWSSSNHEGASGLALTEVELVAEPEATPNRAWTCAESPGPNWVEAISCAHCSEVLLTARLGNDLSAKHLVLELAELLTFKLTESQPRIRVVFLPTATLPTANAMPGTSREPDLRRSYPKRIQPSGAI